MKKSILYIGILLGLCVACDRADLEFRDFTKDGETIYPGVISGIEVHPGNYRVELAWNPSPDPNVSGYVIYWNNRKDSLRLSANSSNPLDTIRATITGLQEYIYTFVIQSLDDKGHRSVPIEVNNAKVYGNLYQERLLNRPYDADLPYEVADDGTVALYWKTPDTVNTNTEVIYTKNSGQEVTLHLAPTDSILQLADFKFGTDVRYRSSYKPDSSAIDTFEVSEYSDFAPIYKAVLANPSLFAAVQLPNDMGILESGTGFDKLWDGSVGPQSYPNVFHSDGSSALPGHFTFDLGKTYNRLAYIEVTGRDCCHNPLEFEVWGIADLNGAETTLAGNNDGWKDESIARGWTLLADVTRTDDGSAPVKFPLQDRFAVDDRPIRYIRIRVRKVVTGENYVNLGELRFWNNE